MEPAIGLEITGLAGWLSAIFSPLPLKGQFNLFYYSGLGRAKAARKFLGGLCGQSKEAGIFRGGDVSLTHAPSVPGWKALTGHSPASA
jgi:hypothetical protein